MTVRQGHRDCRLCNTSCEIDDRGYCHGSAADEDENEFRAVDPDTGLQVPTTPHEED